MTLEQDSYGFPILPEVSEMDDPTRAKRRFLGLRYAAKRRAIEETLKDSDENTRDSRLMELDTSLEATEALGRAGLLAKIVQLASQYDDMAGEVTRVNETARFGAHWCAKKDTQTVHPAVELAWIEADGFVASFGTMLTGLDRCGFTDEEIRIIEAVADSSDV